MRGAASHPPATTAPRQSRDLWGPSWWWGGGVPGCAPPGVFISIFHGQEGRGRHAAILGCGILSPRRQHRCGARFSRTELQIAQGARGGFLRHPPKSSAPPPPPAMHPAPGVTPAGTGLSPPPQGRGGERRDPHGEDGPATITLSLTAPRGCQGSLAGCPCPHRLCRPSPGQARSQYGTGAMQP